MLFRHAEFQRLGPPTALLLVGSHICIGTQSGAVLGVPKASAQRGGADFAVELKPPGGVGRLLTSLFARCSCQSSSLAPCPACAAKQKLDSVHMLHVCRQLSWLSLRNTLCWGCNGSDTWYGIL